MTAGELNLMDYIPVGEANAVSMAELAALLGVDTRIIRKTVNELRTNGEIICSGNSGYWLPEEPTDSIRYYKRARSMALSILKTLRAVRGKLREAGIEAD